jgi:LysR family transcriptional regulator, nitrogen assimilation regulatory protein
MNFRQLKYFSAVVELGNMTRAAEELRVSQTALGMQIRQLEEDLGVALLVRHSRGIEPTKAGTLLHAHAIEILRRVQQARNDVARCDEEQSEVIRLGLTPGLMVTVAATLAVDVRERQPQVTLRLVEEMSHVLIGQLIGGELDLALAYDVPDTPDLVRTALLQDDLVLATLPGSHAEKPIPLVDALKDILAMPEQGDTIRQAIAQAARGLGIDLKVAYEVRSVSAIKGLVARGAAAAILPYALVIEDVRNGILDARPIVMPSVRRTLFLASTNKRPQLRNEPLLVGAIKRSLQEHIDALGVLAHPLCDRVA